MKTTKTSLCLLVLAAVTLSFAKINDWYLFENKSCKVLFPQKPTDQTQTVKSAVGDLLLTIHLYQVPDSVIDDNLVYGLFETEYPKGVVNTDNKDSVDSFFARSVDGAVGNVQGKLLSANKIQIDNYPGREIRINYQQGLAIIKMRFYLVKNKIYILQTMTYTKNDANKSIDRFMDSFSLVK